MRQSLLLGLFCFTIGCATHPITYDEKKPFTPLVLKPTSNILLLTYMSNKESTISVSLMNTTHKYFISVEEHEALAKLLAESFKENVNAKAIPSSVLSAAPTYSGLEPKYRESGSYLNLNQGMLIFDPEDFSFVPKIATETKADAVILLRANYQIVSMNSIGITLNGFVFDPQGNLVFSKAVDKVVSFESVMDDPLDGAGAKAGAVLNALSLTFVHTKTKGIQPILQDTTKTQLGEFLDEFATVSKIPKKKKK